MSMNETFHQMKAFHAELRQFNDQLTASMSDLQSNHDRVAPIWQDDMRKDYDARWAEFDEKMKYYLSREGPAYVQFLDQKLRALSQYLGHR